MFKQRHQHQPVRPLWKSMAGAVMTALFLLVLAASLSPEIHHLFHCDAHSSHHHCVATQIAAGQLVDSPAMVSLSAPVWPASLILRPGESLRLPARDVRLMPERAPPFPAA